MKTLVFNIESSKDVDLAVELIKKLNAPVEVISSPVAESKDPVATYYEQKVEVPVEAKEISREEEEEELLIKQAAEAEAKEKAERAAAEAAAKAEADKKARAAAKAEALKAKAEAEQARLEKEAEAEAVAKAEAEAVAKQAKAEARAEAEAEAKAEAEAAAAAQKAKEERAALREKRTEPAEGTHISFEMIRIKMMKRIKEGAYTRESMTELLAKYGAKSLSNVKESDFAQLYYDLN